MSATIIDSNIFGNIFSTDAMRPVWSDENRPASTSRSRRRWRSCRAGSASFPQEAADEIVRNCDIGKIDMDKLRAQTERIGYPILGVVSQLNALCRDKLGEYCHWGATTQDITDTATVLQIREALAIVEADLAAISAALAELCATPPRYADGRAQQPAAGDSGDLRLQDGDDSRRRRAPSRAARAVAAARAGRRVRRRLRHAGVDRARRDGDAGRPDGGAWAWAAADRVAHRARHIAEVGCFLGLVGGTLGKMSMDVKLMMQTEVAEVYEPFAHGRGSSSTMPQKRNPISCCYIHAACRSFASMRPR